MPPRGYHAESASDYPPMTAAEYEAARELLNLNGVNFARLLGQSWRNGQRFQAGEPIPETVARLIRTIVNNRLSVDEVG